MRPGVLAGPCPSSYKATGERGGGDKSTVKSAGLNAEDVPKQGLPAARGHRPLTPACHGVSPSVFSSFFLLL